jgi:hypothetical protein
MKSRELAVSGTAVAILLASFLAVVATPDAGTRRHPWMLTFEGIGELTTTGMVVKLPYVGPSARQDCERAAAEFDRAKAKHIRCYYEWF